MKKTVLFLTILLMVAGLVIIGCSKPQPPPNSGTTTPPAASPQAAAPAVDYVVMYKTFFTNLGENKHKEAWDSLDKASKEIIAKAIADESKGKLQMDKVITMLENDEGKMRTSFFEGFTKSSGIKFNELVEKGKYTIKSTGDNGAIVTIEFQNEPKDFNVVKEGDVWKVAFFSDIMKSEPAGVKEPGKEPGKEPAKEPGKETTTTSQEQTPPAVTEPGKEPAKEPMSKEPTSTEPGKEPAKEPATH